MTVQELIDRLERFPKDARVKIFDYYPPSLNDVAPRGSQYVYVEEIRYNSNEEAVVLE